MEAERDLGRQVNAGHWLAREILCGEAEDETGSEQGIVTKLSHRPVADTVARLTGMISAKGLRLFAVIDQRAEAQQAGLELRETANLAGIDALTDALVAP